MSQIKKNSYSWNKACFKARRDIAFDNLAHLGYDEKGRPVFIDLKSKKINVPDKWVEIFKTKLRNINGSD